MHYTMQLRLLGGPVLAMQVTLMNTHTHTHTAHAQHTQHAHTQHAHTHTHSTCTHTQHTRTVTPNNFIYIQAQMHTITHTHTHTHIHAHTHTHTLLPYPPSTPKGKDVLGFHNWIQFYLQEKAGNVDYQGYILGKKVRYVTAAVAPTSQAAMPLVP